MIVDQQEIDALLAERAAASAKRAAASERPAAPPPEDIWRWASPEVRRILKVRVPVIIRLAARSMPISKIRQLSTGAIIEFDKSVDDDLSLYIRNRGIGAGHAVKVGEHFGLRITDIGSRRERILSLRAK